MKKLIAVFAVLVLAACASNGFSPELGSNPGKASDVRSDSGQPVKDGQGVAVQSDGRGAGTGAQ